MTHHSEMGTSTATPHFIVIGAQRCGTTWMQRSLIDHSEIYVPAWRTGSIYLADDDMAGYSGEPLVGVFDATLLTRQEVPGEINTLASTVKLLAVVRNPVDRAYSWYHLRLRQGDGLYREQPSFEEALKLDPDLVSNGIYTPYLEQYIQLVGEDRMWIGVFDDLKDDPLRFMGDVLAFVGAENTSDLPAHWAESVNYASLVRNRRLHMFARRAKARTKSLLGLRNQWLVDRLEQSSPVKAFKQANESTVPLLNQAARVGLYEAFADDVAALEELLGRDLSQWRPTIKS